MQRAGRTLLGALILLILLLAICAAVVYHATSSSAENRKLAQHSLAVMQSAEALLTLVQDAETGQRGYILTHQQQYLSPYQAASVQIPPAFDTLRSLLTTTPAEIEKADRLRGAIHTKLFELQKTIDVAQSQGFDAATQIVLTDVGKQAMDEIRATIRGLVSDEGDLLNTNRADVYFWDRVNLIVGGVGGTVVLIALIIAAMLTHRSVSQLERAERSLREQAGLLQGTLDNVRDGVATFDADGRLSAANRRFFKLMNFPARLGEVGRPLADFLAIDAARPERMFVEVPPPAADEGGIVRRISVDKRDLEIYRNAMPGGGFIVTCMDITQRLRTEAGLRQSQKMESIGQLTGGVAHDFNNLLQVIVGNIEFLIRAAKDAPAMLSRATSALLAAQRGAQLTRQLLAFARRQPLNPVPINPGRLIQGMTELLRRTLGEQIQIEAIVAGGLWNTLVDPTQLESAVLNLAINARDAMAPGGKLTIEVGNAFLDDAYAAEHGEVNAGQYVMLAVTDTGSGMPADVVARAFEPFFTTKPEGQGTGLGLSMVYGLVKQSGGHVKIYSEPGQGTTVKLYLPRERRAEIELDNTRAKAALGGNERILVVEDDARGAPDRRRHVAPAWLSGLDRGERRARAGNAEGRPGGESAVHRRGHAGADRQPRTGAPGSIPAARIVRALYLRLHRKRDHPSRAPRSRRASAEQALWDRGAGPQAAPCHRRRARRCGERTETGRGPRLIDFAGEQGLDAATIARNERQRARAAGGRRCAGCDVDHGYALADRCCSRASILGRRGAGFLPQG